MYGKIASTYDKKIIDISTHHRISILDEDSGIGKTYVIKALQDALDIKQTNAVKAYMHDNKCNLEIILENEKKEDLLKKASSPNSIIIIDEADIILGDNPEVVDIIYENETSSYILILRGCPKGLFIGQDDYLVFSFNPKERKISIFPYIQDIKGFFED